MGSSEPELARLRAYAKGVELKEDLLDYLRREEKYVEAKRPRVKVFLSYCERNKKNEYLIEDVVDPFLEGLNFEVHYYRKDIKLGIPFKQIEELIDMCDIIIGFYTCDKETADGKFSAADNVVHEVAYARNKMKLAIVEEGTVIGSLDYSEIPCIQFTREKHGKLLVVLLGVLKRSKLLNVNTVVI